MFITKGAPTDVLFHVYVHVFVHVDSDLLRDAVVRWPFFDLVEEDEINNPGLIPAASSRSERLCHARSVAVFLEDGGHFERSRKSKAVWTTFIQYMRRVTLMSLPNKE